MKKSGLLLILLLMLTFSMNLYGQQSRIRILIITGGHEYNRESFSALFNSMKDSISFEIKEFPAAFEMFREENRNRYDVLVFYHMWQNINEEEKVNLAETIKSGKPLLVLHHSICAFDKWDEYTRIIGGKYFHDPTLINGKQFPPSDYKHDMEFVIKSCDSQSPLTRGIGSFRVLDETYKGMYVNEKSKPFLKTDESTSTNIIGWTNIYGKGKVVVVQPGHDTPIFENQNYRRILLKSITWLSK